MTEMLFLKAKTLEQWREVAATTHAAQYERLLAQAASYAVTPLPPSEHPDDSITYIGMAAANLALANLLTDDPAYLETLRDWLKVGIGYDHWGKARMPDHDLDAAWLLFGFSLAYNWIGDRLPEDEREALVAKLRLQGERLYNFSVEMTGESWTREFWQNHNWICNGGFLTAAYALASDDYDTSAWIEDAIVDFKRVVSVFPEDGSDYEGVVYWRYGFQFLLFPLHLLAQESGIDLHDNDFIRHAFDYRIAVAGPNLIDTANFGDCHDRRSAHSRMMLYRLASVYRNGHAQWLAQHFEEIGEWEREGREGLVKPGLLPEAWVDFVWYDPTVEPESVESLPTTQVFPDGGLLTTRSSWQGDATYLAFKCGTPNGARGWQLGQAIDRKTGWKTIGAGHEHPDENSFILMRGDDYLTVDPGYSSDKRTCNHSTLLIDGQGQYNEGGYDAFRGLDQSWGGRLEDWFVAPKLTYVCGEAAGAYHPDLQLSQFRRQMVRVGDGLVLICDDLASSQSHHYESLFQTDVPAEIASDDRFIFNTPNTRMTITALTPTIHALRETVISANPTSAKPDWIITRTQHTLVLSPPEPCKQARIVAALDLADTDAPMANVTAVDCIGGTALQVDDTFTAFAEGQSRLVVDGLFSADASWLVTNRETDEFWAGHVTNLWLKDKIVFLASTAVDVAVSAESCTIVAKRQTWVSLAIKPENLHCNGQPIEFQATPLLNLIRFAVEAGESHLSWKEQS